MDIDKSTNLEELSPSQVRSATLPSRPKINLLSPKPVNFQLETKKGWVIEGEDQTDDKPLFGWALCEDGEIYPLYVDTRGDGTPKPRTPTCITHYGVIYQSDSEELINKKRNLAQKKADRYFKSLDTFGNHASREFSAVLNKVYIFGVADFIIDFFYYISNPDIESPDARFRSAVIGFCEKYNIEFKESFLCPHGSIAATT